MEKGVYRYKVKARNVDFSKQITIVSLVDFVLEAAGEDADKNGFGVVDLNKQNHSWVLSRMSLEISAMPVDGETFIVTTWVNEIGRMMTTRNMIISNASDEIIGGAVTSWAMIDLTTRRPLDLSANENYLKAVIDNDSPIDHPCKVRVGAECIEREHRVVYSDIDFNGHTNTMKYLEMMFDTMPMTDLEGRKFRRLDVNFLHESRYGDSLNIRFCDAESDKSCFEIVSDDSMPICRAQVSWQ